MLLKYNLSPLNRPPTENNFINTKVVFSENLNFITFGFAKFIPTFVSFNGQLRAFANVELLTTINTKAVFSERLTAKPAQPGLLLNSRQKYESRLENPLTNVFLWVNSSQHYKNTLDNSTHLGAIFSKEIEFNEALQAAAHLGAVFHLRQSYNENLASYAHVGKFINVRALFSSVLHGMVIIGNREYQSVFPPGWELRIDSHNKTAVLVEPPTGIESVRHLYNGDWIFLNRNVQELVLTAGGERLQGEVIYSDWWL